MPITYSFDQEQALIRTVVAGELTFDDTLIYFEQLIQDSECPDNPIEIVDFEEVTDFNIRYSEMANIIDVFQKTKDADTIKATVFYCPSDLSYGIARMLEVHHGLVNVNHLVHVARTLDELDQIVEELQSG